MKWLPARPTIYRGIRMRSRLEADFAQWLDSDPDWLCFDEEERWEYEPVCFAGIDGQYLPDFRITGGLADRYIEVKPPAAAHDDSPDFSSNPVEKFLRRMEIIWETDPRAELHLIFWEYKADEPKLVIRSDGWNDRLWRVTLPGFMAWGTLLWGGRNQWRDLLNLRDLLAKAERSFDLAEVEAGGE